VLDSNAHFYLWVLFEMRPTTVLPNFVFIEFLYVMCIFDSLGKCGLAFSRAFCRGVCLFIRICTFCRWGNQDVL
jgi:hypothetical protein